MALFFSSNSKNPINPPYFSPKIKKRNPMTNVTKLRFLNAPLGARTLDPLIKSFLLLYLQIYKMLKIQHFRYFLISIKSIS